MISGGTRLGRSVKLPLPEQNQRREPAPAAGENPDMSESVQAAGPGQLGPVSYPGAESAAVSKVAGSLYGLHSDVAKLLMALLRDSAASSSREPAAGDAHDESGSGDEIGDRRGGYTPDLGNVANTGNKSTASRCSIRCQSEIMWRNAEVAATPAGSIASGLTERATQQGQADNRATVLGNRNPVTTRPA